MAQVGVRVLAQLLRPCLRQGFRRALHRPCNGLLAPTLLCRRHSVLLERLNGGVRWYQTAPVRNSEETQFARFQELLRQGMFGRIVEVWGREEESVRTDPTLYPLVVMAMERTGQSKSPQAFLDDVLGLEDKRSLQAVPISSVALALECAKQFDDYTTAGKIYTLFWKTSCSPKAEEMYFSDACSENCDWLLRAINAAIFLQAVCARDLKAAGTVETPSEVKSFLQHRYFEQIRYLRLTPNADTYEAILLLCCFKSEAIPWARSTSHLVGSGAHPLTPQAFTSWTHHCGALHPLQAYKGILHTVWEHIQYRGKVVLPLEQYSELLGVRYQGESRGVNNREAVACVFRISSMMKKQGVLVTTEACNLILRAFARLGAIGPMYATLTANPDISPDIQTFHTLVDGCLVEGGVRSAKGAVYQTWRMLVMSEPSIQPNIDLINKLIRCCEVCQDFDRAFFFLSALNDFSLHPNLETFSLLFRICKAMKDGERFSVVVSLAHSCLPNETASINRRVSSIEHEWQAEEDASLTSKLISENGPG